MQFLSTWQTNSPTRDGLACKVLICPWVTTAVYLGSQAAVAVVSYRPNMFLHLPKGQQVLYRSHAKTLLSIVIVSSASIFCHLQHPRKSKRARNVQSNFTVFDCSVLWLFQLENKCILGSLDTPDKNNLCDENLSTFLSCVLYYSATKKKVELPDYLNEKDNNARIKSPSQTEVYFWIGLFITKAQGEKNQELVKR